MPLGARQRKAVWKVFERLIEALEREGLSTWSQLCRDTADLLESDGESVYSNVIADEAQDFGPAELRLLRALVAGGENDILLAADEGQRIYKGRFSWSDLGLSVRGRSTRLKVNYRTTEQIREFADGLLPGTIAAQDGSEGARATVSLLSGPTPEIVSAGTSQEESEKVAEWLSSLLKTGYGPGDIAIFGRSEAVLRDRAIPAVKQCGVSVHNLKDDEIAPDGCVSIGTMHRAKGLEYKAVVVMGCEEGLIPLRTVLRKLEDPADREEFEEQERHLLYVASTRARERLLVSHSRTPSRFLSE